MSMVEGASAKAGRANRRAIPAQCGVHGGPRGFTNVVVERKDVIGCDLELLDQAVVELHRDPHCHTGSMTNRHVTRNIGRVSRRGSGAPVRVVGAIGRQPAERLGIPSHVG